MLSTSPAHTFGSHWALHEASCIHILRLPTLFGLLDDLEFSPSPLGVAGDLLVDHLDPENYPRSEVSKADVESFWYVTCGIRDPGVEFLREFLIGALDTATLV